ncbi:MAG: hypothetical protein LBI74_03750 [Synergistaceae bacterium]|jgi:hypothetical protein|nr:hypothetical protein [Synergistaceae bacterium]
MTLRDLLSKFSLDELWYYLSMRHELQSKPIKARKIRELYGVALSELLAFELNRDEIRGELSCDFFAEKTDDWENAFFDVTLKEAGKTYSLSFLPWKDLIDLPVSQTSLDHYGEWLCAAEILWEVTFWGFSADKVASESAKLEKSSEEAENGEAELIPFGPDEFKHEVNPYDIEVTLAWFASAPDCVKRSVRNCISSNTARDEDDEQLAVAKTFEKLKGIVGDKEPKTEDITWLPLAMTRGLDVDDELLLLKAFDGTLN